MLNRIPHIPLLALMTLGLLARCVTVDDRRDVVDDTPSGQVSTDASPPSIIPSLGTGGPCAVEDDCTSWVAAHPCLGALCKEGICHAIALENGWPCSDGDHLTRGDSCLAGTCRAGTNICVCSDDLDCHVFDNDDPCDGQLRCDGCACVVNEPLVGTPCDDGDATTWNDQCVNGGICQGQSE